MRPTAPAILSLLLGGCSVVPPQAWTFDPTHPQPQAASAALPSPGPELVQLYGARDAIRNRIATAPDARERLPLYAELHRVGVRISAAERSLYAPAAFR